MSGGKHLGKGSKLPEIPKDGKLVLYSMRFCPYAQRAHLVLAAKNLEFHTVYINLSEKPEWLPEKSPLGKVPALEVPNQKEPLIESTIICDYLDEAYSQNPLHSKDPLQKAYDKILIERFGPTSSAMRSVFIGDSAETKITEVCNGFDIFENELKKRGTKFFGGDKIGMLDYMIWPWVERSELLKHLMGGKYQLDQARYPHLLQQWSVLMKNDAAVKTHCLDGETHAKFIASYSTGAPDYDMLV